MKRIFLTTMAILFTSFLGIGTVFGQLTFISLDENIVIRDDGEYVITGYNTPSTHKITIADGVTATVTLSNVHIDLSGTKNGCAFKVNAQGVDTAHLTLILSGENSLISGENCAGLEVNSRNVVEIKAETGLTDKLTVTGGELGAGIGGGYDKDGANITISGGTIIAKGGRLASGIGGGAYGAGENITINGGAVDATGKSGGAGIGGGFDQPGSDITINGGTVNAISDSPSGGGAGIGGGFFKSGENITISGGTVTATGGKEAAGIGSGPHKSSSHITISGGTVIATGKNGGAGIGSGNGATGNPDFSTNNADGSAGNAFIITSSLEDKPGEALLSGVIIESDSGLVYGNPTISTDAELSSGKILIIDAEHTLTIANGTTLTNNGTILMKVGSSATGIPQDEHLQYEIKYDANDATSGNVPDDAIKTYGIDYTVAENTGSLERTDYQFKGWNTQADGQGDDYATGATYATNEPTTLYAKWQLFSQGTGSLADPYQIATLDDLKKLMAHSECWDKHFIQTADIDCNNETDGITPIGNFSTHFTGSYRGASVDGSNITETLRKVSNLTMDKGSENRIALFGSVERVNNDDNSGKISYIGVENANITGRSFVGGLVGEIFFGTVTHSYATGQVSCALDKCGGLVGYNEEGTISNSYATGQVFGSIVGGLVGGNKEGTVTHSYATGQVFGTSDYAYVGGLVGGNDESTVIHSYATGQVSCTGYSDNVGGLVGYNNHSTITHSYATGQVSGTSVGGLVGYDYNGTYNQCFWDKETTGQTTSSGLGEEYGKTTAEMRDIATYTTDITDETERWKIGVADDDVWHIDMDNSPTDDNNNGYPTLAWEGKPHTLPATYSGGEGTLDNPFQIATLEDLKTLMSRSKDWDKHFIQTADIDCNNETDGITPIGNRTTHFTGSYKGASVAGSNITDTLRKISNLTIDKSSEDCMALFGFVEKVNSDDNSGKISHVGLENATIKGNEFIGGLVGYNLNGSLTFAYCKGTITATSIAGVLIGENNGGTVSKSFSTGSVDATGDDIGGLLGKNNDGEVSNCYSTSSVSGNEGVGGFVGRNEDGNITNSYSTGSVTGSSYLGGFVGYSNNGSFSNCFYNIENPQNNNITGITGKTTAAMQNINTYIDVWAIGTEADDVWHIDEANLPTDDNNQGYPTLAWEGKPHSVFGYSGGEGTLDEPYQIATLADLKKLMARSSDWDNHFIQTADIDCNNETDGITPIGIDPDDDDITFTGSYRGASVAGSDIRDTLRKITNLTMDKSSEECVALFGFIQKVNDDENTGKISYIGVENANITGGGLAGGLVGYNEGGTVTRSYATGQVSVTESEASVGGLVGANDEGSITYSYATTQVFGTKSESAVGGLLGISAEGIISNSYATGQVSGADSSYVGGLVGFSEEGDAISNSYATGQVSATDSSYVGSFVGVGLSDTIINSYATGQVSGTNSSYVGGFVGYSEQSIYTQCFWDKETTGQDTSAGLGDEYGKTTAEMMHQTSYTDWSFADVWHIDMNDGANNGYPTLAWQNLPNTKRQVTVTPEDGQSKIYGDEDTTITFTFTELLLGDDESIFTGALSRATGDTVGTYAILQGDLSIDDDNYELNFVTDKTFVITQKSITVTADNLSKVEGADDPELTYTVAPALLNNDEFTGELTRQEGETVGEYAIWQGSLSAGNNYAITFVQGTFTIDSVKVTGVSIEGAVDTLHVSDATQETVQLTANLQPENATDQNVTWSSSDDAIATVSESGLVTAVAKGTVTITVTTTDGGHTASCDIVVDEVLSIAGITNSVLRIYPNPVVEGFVVETENESETLEIYTSTGVKVLQTQLTSDKQYIDVSSLQSGLYVARIGDNDVKFIKR